MKVVVGVSGVGEGTAAGFRDRDISSFGRSCPGKVERLASLGSEDVQGQNSQNDARFKIPLVKFDNTTSEEITRRKMVLPSRSESSTADRELAVNVLPLPFAFCFDRAFAHLATFRQHQNTTQASSFPQCSSPNRSKERAPLFVPLVPVFLQLRTNCSGLCPLSTAADRIQTQFAPQCRCIRRRSHSQIPPQTTQHSTSKSKARSMSRGGFRKCYMTSVFSLPRFPLLSLAHHELNSATTPYFNR